MSLGIITVVPLVVLGRLGVKSSPESSGDEGMRSISGTGVEGKCEVEELLNQPLLTGKKRKIANLGVVTWFKDSEKVLIQYKW